MAACGYKQTIRPRRRNVRFTPDSRHSSADHFARRGDGANQKRRDANVGSGDIEAVRVSIRGRSSFNTGSGDVEVELSKPTDYDLSVNSGSGDATLDFGGNAIEGTVVMKANKRNGSIKAPFDFDSSEEIDNGNSTVVKKTKKLGTNNIDIKVGTGSGTAKILK